MRMRWLGLEIRLFSLLGRWPPHPRPRRSFAVVHRRTGTELIDATPMEEERTTTTITTSSSKRRQVVVLSRKRNKWPRKKRTLTSRLLSQLPLPFDVIAEILCRLPVKQLMQLRCLCKSFNYLISHPNFAKIHLHMSTTRHYHHHLIIFKDTEVDTWKTDLISYPLHSIFHSGTIEPVEFDYPLENNRRQNNIADCYVVGSCNGLVCLAFRTKFNRHVLYQRYVFLWNPSIRKFSKLRTYKDRTGHGATICGFGYDSVNGLYKMLALYDCIRLKVHTLGTNSWRMVHADLGILHDQLMKFVSGALNWIFCDDNDADPADRVYSVASFDLVNESYRKLLPPKYWREHGKFVTLNVLRDSLSFCVHSRTCTTIWLMKEYGNEESWIKLCLIPISGDSHIYYPFFLFYPFVKPLWIFEDDQVLMSYPWPWMRARLNVYDFKNDTVQIPMIQNINDWFIREACVAVESLISPRF